MDSPEDERRRGEVIRGAALLAAVVGALALGTVGPEGFAPETVADATAATVAAVASASPAPFFAAGLLAGGLSLLVRAEFGPFGSVRSDRGTAAGRVACETCGHSIDGSRAKCPYCRTPTRTEDDDECRGPDL